MAYDVLVVGAGPAGGSTALHAARAGLKTLLIEEHPTVGEPVHCGECLSDEGARKLPAPLPDDVIGLRVNGIRVIFPDGTGSLVTEPGYVLEKQKFEQWIAAQAKEAGAEVRTGTPALGATRDGGPNGIWKVQTKGGVLESKVLVDATGVKAFFSAKLNLNARFQSVIGMQYELQDVPNDAFLDFYVWPELAPAGYLWMIPKDNGRANVGLVTNQNNKAKTFLDEFVKRKGWGAKKVNVRNPLTPTAAFGGLIPASGPLPNTTADGLMLVGDAAGFTSPLFDGGTHLSLTSGKFAAQTAAEAIAAGDVSKAGLAKYEQRWRAEFPDYAKIIDGRHKLYAFTDNELNDVAHCLPPDLGKMSALDKLGVGAKLLLRNPRLYAKGVIPALLAFGYSRAKHYGW